jgi:hypothetical protein
MLDAPQLSARRPDSRRQTRGQAKAEAGSVLAFLVKRAYYFDECYEQGSLRSPAPVFRQEDAGEDAGVRSSFVSGGWEVHEDERQEM